MNLKDYDNIKIPTELNDYIDKGIEKGIKYKQKSHKRNFIKVASLFLIGSTVLVSASNIPVVAKELIKIPVLGNVVKILSINDSSIFGGLITDGNTVVIDSLEDNSVNIYFTKDDALVEGVPHYEIEYSEYPYTIVFTFDGVRGIYDTNIQEKVENLSWIKDVYNIMTLDDSRRKIAIELNENIDFKITEYEEPGMIQISYDGLKQIENKSSYFVRTNEFNYGEELAQIEESLSEYEGSEVQKVNDGTYIIQYGPFYTKEEAEAKLKKLNEDTELNIDFYLESRNIGEGPKIK